MVHPVTGQLLSGSTWTYKIPTPDVIPQQFNVHFLEVSNACGRLAPVSLLFNTQQKKDVASVALPRLQLGTAATRSHITFSVSYVHLYPACGLVYVLDLGSGSLEQQQHCWHSVMSAKRTGRVCAQHVASSCIAN